MGHAGSDVQSVYLSDNDIDAMHHHDPLLYTARILIDNNIYQADEIITLYKQMAEDVEQEAKNAIIRPKLTTSDDIKASLIPPKRSHNFTESHTNALNLMLTKLYQWLGISIMHFTMHCTHIQT